VHVSLLIQKPEIAKNILGMLIILLYILLGFYK